MKDLEVSKQLPVITTNFEDVRSSLMETISKYKGIVVTEEGLKDCKATQKELAGLRNNIDSYRKAVKKEVLVPVTEFEINCKELEKLIVDVEAPIKEGITVFDNKRREEKKTKALEFISESVQAHQLNEKYSNRLTVLDKYFALTGSVKAVKEDIEVRAENLKIQQDSEERELEQLIASINMYVTTFNEDINLKLIAKDFYKYIDKGYTITTITSLIKEQHDKIKEAENPKPVEPPKEEIKQAEPVKQIVSDPAPVQSNFVEAPIKQEEELFFYDLKIIANFENFQKLIELLKSDGFKYAVKGKGRV